MVIGHPVLCSGIITEIIDTTSYEVELLDSPLGGTIGNIQCTSVYSTGFDNNYKKGDIVKINISFLYDASEQKYINMSIKPRPCIIGIDNNRELFNEFETGVSDMDSSTIHFRHKNSYAGVSASEKGHAMMYNSSGD